MVGGVGGDVSQTVPQAFPLALDLVTGVHREGFFGLRGPVCQKTKQDKCQH